VKAFSPRPATNAPGLARAANSTSIGCPRSKKRNNVLQKTPRLDFCLSAASFLWRVVFVSTPRTQPCLRQTPHWDLDVVVVPVFQWETLSFIMSIPYTTPSPHTVIAGNTTAVWYSATGTDAVFNIPDGITIVFGAIGATLNPILSTTGSNIPYGYLVTDFVNSCVRVVNATGTHGTSSPVGSCNTGGGYRDGVGSNALFTFEGLQSVRVDRFNGWGVIADDCCVRGMYYNSSLSELAASTLAGMCTNCTTSPTLPTTWTNTRVQCCAPSEDSQHSPDCT